MKFWISSRFPSRALYVSLRDRFNMHFNMLSIIQIIMYLSQLVDTIQFTPFSLYCTETWWNAIYCSLLQMCSCHYLTDASQYVNLKLLENTQESQYVCDVKLMWDRGLWLPVKTCSQSHFNNLHVEVVQLFWSFSLNDLFFF